MFTLLKNKNKKKGFTLIELLAVVVIIGVMMIIAVPSVTEYINDSKKKTYINSAQSYIKETKNMITSRELRGLKRKDTTFYIPISCLHTESGGDSSSFGEWEYAFVAVIYTGKEYKFYWTSNDVTNHGVSLTPEALLSADSVKYDVQGVSTSIGIGGRTKISVLNEATCTVETAESKEPQCDVDEENPDVSTCETMEILGDAPEYTVQPGGWAQKKTVSIKYSTSSFRTEYSLDGGITWLTYNGPIEFTANGNVIARSTLSDGSYIMGSSFTVSQIDTTPPEKATITTTSTTNTITVTATASDKQSGIKYYQFSKDNGATWTDLQEGKTYTFTGLVNGTYNIKMRAVNKTYENHGLSGNVTESAVKATATKEITVPTYTLNPNTSNWVQKKTVTINFASGFTNEYSLDGGSTWQVYTAPLLFTEPGSVISKSSDGVNYVNSSVQTITNIDPTAPTSSSFTYETTSKTIKVTASGSDSESGIHHYQFSKDGGTTWSEVQSSNVYTFTNLTTGTYNVKVRVFNNTYTHHGISNNYKESDTKSIATVSISEPTYSISPSSGWATSKTVTITYPSGYTNEYSIDGGTTWKPYTSAIKFTSNATLIARVNDGVNYVSGSSQTITNVDSTAPTAASFSSSATSKSITVVASGTDSESGIIRYQFSKDNGTTWTTEQTSNTYTFNNLSTGTYKVKVRVINGTYVNNGINNNYLDSAYKDVTTLSINVPTYTISPNSGWAQKKTVTIAYSSGYTNQYSTDGGNTWRTYPSSGVEFTNPGSIIARSHDGVNYVSGSSQTVTSVDSTAPTAASFTYTVTSKSITVVASGTDNESGIFRYQFSKDNGSTWTSEQSSNTYTFSNLTTGTYPIMIRVINRTYETHGISNNYKNSTKQDVSTTSISAPTYSVSPSGWSGSKTVTINYPSGYTNQYSLDNGTTWHTYSSPLQFYASGSVIAKVTDGINSVTGSSYSVSNIDGTAPSISATSTVTVSTAVVKISISDSGESGLYGSNNYKYCISTSNSSSSGCTWNTYSSGVNYTHNNLNGTYYIWVYPIRDNAGNINDGKTNISTPYVIKGFTAIAEYNKTITSCGGAQTFTAPYSGYYEIDLYGAQGANGNGGGCSGGSGGSAGKGGNVKGRVELTAGETLTVYVGCAASGNTGGLPDGSNGAGSPNGVAGDGGGGGGSTYITKGSTVYMRANGGGGGGGGGDGGYHVYSSGDGACWNCSNGNSASGGARGGAGGGGTGYGSGGGCDSSGSNGADGSSSYNSSYVVRLYSAVGVQSGNGKAVIKFLGSGYGTSSEYTQPGQYVFKAAQAGTYQFTLYGAEGGSGGTGLCSGGAGGDGGKGGYVTGRMYLDANTTLYIYVGEKGQDASYGVLNGYAGFSDATDGAVAGGVAGCGGGGGGSSQVLVGSTLHLRANGGGGGSGGTDGGWYVYPNGDTTCGGCNGGSGTTIMSGGAGGTGGGGTAGGGAPGATCDAPGKNGANGSYYVSDSVSSVSGSSGSRSGNGYVKVQLVS